MRKKIQTLFRILTVALFIGYYGSCTLFYHTHHFAWGVVVHSHPYLPGSGGMPDHPHTPSECQTIAQLSYLLLILTAPPALGCRVSTVRFYFRSCRKRLTELFLVHQPLRAPPFSVYP